MIRKYKEKIPVLGKSTNFSPGLIHQPNRPTLKAIPTNMPLYQTIALNPYSHYNTLSSSTIDIPSTVIVIELLSLDTIELIAAVQVQSALSVVAALNV